MGYVVIKKLLNQMKKNNVKLINSKILIMGFSFKENCQDIRNSKVVDIVKSLKNKKLLVDIYDPLVDKLDCINEYKIKLFDYPKNSNYDSIIIAVSHNKFKRLGINKIRKL